MDVFPGLLKAKLFVVEDVAFQKLLEHILLLPLLSFLPNALNLPDLAQDLVSRIPTEILNVETVVNNGGIDCCLVLQLHIFGQAVLGIGLFGPGSEECIAVNAAVFLLYFE